MKTRIGIAGYGNLGRGVEFAVAQNPDTELVAVFTRRNPETVKIQTEGVKVYPIAEAASHRVPDGAGCGKVRVKRQRGRSCGSGMLTS